MGQWVDSQAWTPQQAVSAWSVETKTYFSEWAYLARRDWPSLQGLVCARLGERCVAVTGRSHAPLQQYQVGAPMERVGVNILGPFPTTDSGNGYVLVAMDYF